MEIANNTYQKQPDPTKDFVQIEEIDVTNAYGEAMLHKMPVKVEWASKKWFKWIEKEIFDHECSHISDDLDFSFYVEVALHFPKNVKAKFRNFPPLPINRPVEFAELSRHTKDLFHENSTSTTRENVRLVSDVRDIERVQLHIMYLKSIMKSGVRVKKLHRAAYFTQTSWIRDFVLFNTKRRNEAKDAFEKSFYKLIINSQVIPLHENE